MHPSSYYNMSSKGKYALVVMESSGKVTIGRTYDTFEEVHKAMIELRMLYAKNEVAHHVGYMEV